MKTLKEHAKRALFNILVGLFIVEFVYLIAIIPVAFIKLLVKIVMM